MEIVFVANLLAMASNLLAMASNLDRFVFVASFEEFCLVT